MPKPYTIHKPTHELRSRFGAVQGLVQLRGSYAMINMADGRKAFAVESVARHLTNYGKGTESLTDKRKMHSALDFLFGADRPDPDMICVKVTGNG